MASDTSHNYTVLKHTKGLPIGKLLATAIGVFGVAVALGSLGSVLMNGLDGLVFVFVGAFLSFLLLPGLYRSGIEIDEENKRFRPYEGMLGNTKGDWIEIEREDYLAIVGVTEARSAGTLRTGVTQVNLAKSKVFFWSGDWHTEVFKGYYEDAGVFANEFAKPFGLWVNDVNKDQNIQGISQGAFNNY